MSKPKKHVNKVGMVLTEEVNVRPKIKQTTSTDITLHKYLYHYKVKDKELYLCIRTSLVIVVNPLKAFK